MVMLLLGMGCYWITAAELSARVEQERAKDAEDSAVDSGGETGETGDTGLPPSERDIDEDGYTADVDCDDGNASVHPDATERCGGVDEDCDGNEDGIVTLDGSESYTRIEDAVLAASEGSTITVCAGTYAENLVLETSVEIEALYGPERTILDGSGLGSVVQVTGGTIRLAGFTIANGAGTDASSARRGGGIYVLYDDPTAELEIDGCVVKGNSVSGTNAFGGGIYVGGTGTVSIVDTEIRDNDALKGGGLYVFGIGGAATVAIEGSTFESNVATEFGGGMYLRADETGSSTVSMTDSGVLGCTAGDGSAGDAGGGAYVYLGILESVASDWGTSAGENDPDDVAVYTAAAIQHYDDYASDASFVCTGGVGCL